MRTKPGDVLYFSGPPYDQTTRWQLGLILGVAHREAMGDMSEIPARFRDSPLLYYPRGDAITVGLRLLEALEREGFGFAKIPHVFSLFSASEDDIERGSERGSSLPK